MAFHEHVTGWWRTRVTMCTSTVAFPCSETFEPFQARIPSQVFRHTAFQRDLKTCEKRANLPHVSWRFAGKKHKLTGQKWVPGGVKKKWHYSNVEKMLKMGVGGGGWRLMNWEGGGWSVTTKFALATWIDRNWQSMTTMWVNDSYTRRERGMWWMTLGSSIPPARKTLF
jgi:hypothetical protein